MASLLDQLYETKARLAAVLIAVAGLLLATISKWSPLVDFVASFPLPVPLGDIGEGLIAAGVLGIVIDQRLRKLDEKRNAESFDEAIKRNAPALRDAVLDSLAFNAKALKGTVSPELLDRVASGALGLRLGDEHLARDLYTDLRDQVIAAEHWKNAKVSVTLSPWEDGPSTGRGSMLVATVRWEYKVVPTNRTMRFASASDDAEYRELLQDSGNTLVWRYDSSTGLDPVSPEVFELLAFSVDGKPRKIQRSVRAGFQQYTANVGREVEADQEVTVAYTYRGLVQRNGHLFQLDFSQPIGGLDVRLDYAHAGIRWMNTADYFAGSQASRVEQARSVKDAKVVNINIDRWVLPRAGVVFVWVLDEELGTP